ncbi:hypothetical protein [Polyangium fumosum]|uniref:DUF805 domain-containing protein n=1 Tax=Polyangium fumosum TaxID=889272 RepID=A0A4U1JDJ7_9BACT|nr:hypothetical protein [Polyangium fumosum]TKD08902.1 hypothetical protein E8A74_14030 [Polyangium fumosum]
MSDTPPSSRPRSRVREVARLWFGLEAPVGRRAYLLTGVTLMALKYGLDTLLVYLASGVLWSPLAYLSPALTLRMKSIPDAPSWLFVVLAVATLPFLWIGISMSIRRAANAGLSPWFGLTFLVPALNYLVMLVLAGLPERGDTWKADPTSPYRAGGPQERIQTKIEGSLRSALLGVATAVAVGLGMAGLSVYALDLYGLSLFFVTPFVMGAVSSFLLNREAPQSLKRAVAVACLSVAITGGAMLLFALEGLVCLLMAAPIAGVVAVIGAILGRAIALQAKTPHTHAAAAVLALPGLVGAEAAVVQPDLREVKTVIEVDAPPDRVWENVIGFGELAPPSEWFFHTGIAYPVRARLEGEGVGAVRYCEFSTGPFVEPITVWDKPHRLAFDVSKQPHAMKEWSPFQYVHAPHLDGSLRSKRGQFLLTELPGGRTRLEGTTWYELEMAPNVYWAFWSDSAIHAIHTRVLEHVKKLSETK